MKEEMTASESRRATPGATPRTSAYFAIIGDPPHCGPGDHLLALAYLQKIDRALVQGGWTPYEVNRLKKLKAKWSRRAFGHDARFNLVGTREGRLPASVEYQLQPKRKNKGAYPGGASRKLMPYSVSPEDDAARAAKCPQSQKRNPERRWPANGLIEVDADLPSGLAKGMSEDPDTDVFEPEAGEMPLPPPPTYARQYLIPGQDTKGHAHRVYCRVMPAHYRAICALERSKHFGFRTPGDLIRWCIDHGVRELSTRAKVPQVISALAQVDTIREILLDEQYYLEFPILFEQLTTTINRHLSAGSIMEATRLIAMVRHQINEMNEPVWKKKYDDELMTRFKQYIDGTQTPGADFGGEAGA